MARRPRALGGGAPLAEGARQDRLDAPPDGLAENRRRAVGRDADDDRRAVDDGAELEVAEGGLVDDVDENPALTRRRHEARGLVRAAIGKREPRPVEILRLPAAMDERDGAAARSGKDRQFLFGFGRHHRDLRAGGRQKLGLPDDAVAAAGDQHALAVEIEEDRQLGERLEARRAGFRRPDVAAHQAASGAGAADVSGPLLAWKSAPLLVAATRLARITKSPKRSPLRRFLA